ncbi:low molecular weight protein-tyrosine-phosphatase [Vibrio sp. TH_r3]|uniref:low molecular weight protein-tyrosine-phosphatase n=1 Tax=Vibrio sp. TH_r3 TaxID=3082084 RepID=UPI0029535226|nr:low molecular weight protein-tyrosine-phosphatase [Vibrio sp. TH_r3]MDV7102888.1 low molecular weight protein-tyrosine-phosphatase [Vibrio sp. TH_r3]
MRKSVLVICTGNICRSPYAESKLKQLLPGSIIESAGLATKVSRLQGKPANSVAIKTAEENDVDISQHKANQLTDELVDKYNIILVMEQDQMDEIIDRFPAAKHKTFLFGQWINVNCIDDPYRQGKHVFRYVFSTINKAAEEWAKKLALF